MNRESFLETVRQQYSERISSAYLYCEHEGRVDVSEFEAQLKPLKRMAGREGISPGEFDELVFSFFPDFRGKIDLDLSGTSKAA